MSGSSAPGGRRLSGATLFIVAHGVAVLLLYSLAWVAGRGAATPAFPPDLPPRAAETVVAQGAGSVAAPVEPPALPIPQPFSQDIAPPWSYDSQGRAHVNGH